MKSGVLALLPLVVALVAEPGKEKYVQHRTSKLGAGRPGPLALAPSPGNKLCARLVWAWRGQLMQLASSNTQATTRWRQEVSASPPS